MKPLGGKIDRLVSVNGFMGREPFLRTGDCPGHRGLKRAFDQNANIKMPNEPPFEKEDAFQQDDVDVKEVVNVLPVGRRGLVHVVGLDADRAAVPQWQYQTLEHLVHSNAAAIEVSGRIIVVESDARQIQPSVDARRRNTEPPRSKSRRKPLGHKSLPAGVDAGNAGEH